MEAEIRRIYNINLKKGRDLGVKDYMNNEASSW